MRPQSRFETSTNSAAQDLWQLTVLISDLRRTVRNFETSIEAEEGRAQVFDMAKASYPILARNFKARRDNLLVTISMLENHLKRAEASAA
jgi:septation ring formation regulator EzrA